MKTKREIDSEILDKYFDYDIFFSDIRCNLISELNKSIMDYLIETQETEYYLNNVKVTEDTFFENLRYEDIAYFKTHNRMSIGNFHYLKKVRFTKTIQQIIELHKSKLDEVDKKVLEGVDDAWYYSMGVSSYLAYLGIKPKELSLEEWYY